MDTSSSNQTPSDISNVRAAFDHIIMNHITRLIESSPLVASLPFNLATISSLLLLVERENEIKTFPDAPPERYTRQTLLDNLADMGLEVNDDLLAAVQNLTQYGFVIIDPENQYAAQKSAFSLVSVLDNLFPGMPGMSFVAYIIQTIDEAISGRKDTQTAISQFDQTLLSRGIPFSKQPTVRPAAEPSRRPVQKVSGRQKETYLQRLTEIRSRTATESSDPAIVTRGGYTGRVEIKELFAKPSEDTQTGIETEDQEVLEEMEPEKAGAEDDAPDSTESTEPSVQEQEVEDVKQETISEEVETEPDKTDQASLLEPAEDFEEVENRTPAASQETDASLTEESIEKRIEEFEVDLAMSCPLCSTGSIRPATTAKGKVFYSCANEGCRFISWGKPYHFKCPLCQNPFLIEFAKKDGAVGLKCPRATCSYWQDWLGSPSLHPKGQPTAVTPEPSTSATSTAKRRKKVVRKRVVRRKR